MQAVCVLSFDSIIAMFLLISIFFPFQYFSSPHCRKHWSKMLQCGLGLLCPDGCVSKTVSARSPLQFQILSSQKETVELVELQHDKTVVLRPERTGRQPTDSLRCPNRDLELTLENPSGQDSSQQGWPSFCCHLSCYQITDLPSRHPVITYPVLPKTKASAFPLIHREKNPVNCPD